jgi:hypothetical protein
VAVIDPNVTSEAPARTAVYLHQQLQLQPSLFKVLLLRDIPYTSSGKIHYEAIFNLTTSSYKGSAAG